MIDHVMYKNSLNDTTKILISGDKYGLHLGKRYFLVLYEWSHFKWPFNTGGRQYQQLIKTGCQDPVNGDCLWEVKLCNYGEQISGPWQPTT